MSDIELPSESGKIDPRLRGYEPGRVRESLGEALKGLKTLRDKDLIGTRSPKRKP